MLSIYMLSGIYLAELKFWIPDLAFFLKMPKS